MANTIVEPTFTLETDRLTFLSRLWGFTITALDVAEWEAHQALYPLARNINETENEFSNRRAVWNDQRVAVPQWMALSKWDGYRLGKVRPTVEDYLSTRPTPNRAQAREAVRLQIAPPDGKYAAEITASGVDVANNLLPLVQSIVW